MAILFSLVDLAFAGHVFDAMTGYDESYVEFRRRIGHSLDLGRPCHRLAMIQWLNRWGCRQFAVAQRDIASESIASWYAVEGAQLPDCSKKIWELDEGDLRTAADLYSGLSRLTASHKIRQKRPLRVTVGPTGASKILYALRPHTYIPWDAKMRDSLRYSDDGVGYAAYLRDIGMALKALEPACVANGFPLDDLPTQLGKPDQTVATLVNAYLWVVVSQGCKPPSGDELRTWVRWSQ